MKQREYASKTFGVISLLGNEQAKVIERLIDMKISPKEKMQRNILCGDSAHFQGDERDIVFLSLVDSGDGTGPLRKMGFGSNDAYLNAERFACYIRGGTCRENGRTYPGCSDTTMWKGSMIKEYPGRMYFANHSGSWQGGGVSFYTMSDCSKKTVMRLYRITYGQFKEIKRQEGASANWYGRIQYLESINGIPVFALTSEKVMEQTTPSEEYLSMLRTALISEAGMTEEKADSYLKSCGKKFPRGLFQTH